MGLIRFRTDYWNNGFSLPAVGYPNETHPLRFSSIFIILMKIFHLHTDLDPLCGQLSFISSQTERSLHYY